MANTLNRSFVLPPLLCNDGRRKYCSLCGVGKGFDCHESYIKLFKNPVKESIFFMKEEVPVWLKNENAMNPIYSFDNKCTSTNSYKSDFPACSSHSHSIVCLSCNATNTECAIQYGRNKRDTVLKYYSLSQ